MSTEIHTPVMLDRCVELLAPAIRDGGVVIDATLGMGGHTERILESCDAARVIGFDRDTDAIRVASERLARFGDRIRIVHSVYDRIDEVLDDLDVPEVNGVLFDLGVSSLQIDRPERGFSYLQDAPLDMRMDASTGETAADVVNSYSEADLTRIFYEYGDEKLAPRIASRIVAAREAGRIETSAQLVEIVDRATPAAMAGRGHNAKRVFQALRIEVNHELDALHAAIPQALDRLAIDGRIVVMSYQSDEDRFVKRQLRERTVSDAPAGLPMIPESHLPEFELLVRGAEQASDDEKQKNPRAVPARLRAARRIRRHS